MSEQNSITYWITEARVGAPEAAANLWRRYVHRLIGLARVKLRNAPKRIADEEDVVVDAFHSFFRGVEAGRFPDLNDRGDLWQVLVMLTARKAANQLKHQYRKKRGAGQVRGESVFMQSPGSAQDFAGIDQVVGVEPTPEFAEELAGRCGELLESLPDETLRHVALAKLEGFTNQEIADQLGCQTRTVERKLKLIRELWSDTNE